MHSEKQTMVKSESLRWSETWEESDWARKGKSGIIFNELKTEK